jgi:hypothetical protein
MEHNENFSQLCDSMAKDNQYDWQLYSARRSGLIRKRKEVPREAVEINDVVSESDMILPIVVTV